MTEIDVAVDAQRTLLQRRFFEVFGFDSADELMTAIGDSGITLAVGGELTRNVYPSPIDSGRVEVLYITDDVGSVGLTPNTAAGAKPFRCVTDPLN